MTLCDKAFSKRQAYAYLEEIQNEFISQYGSKVDTQTRPYSFIEFGEWTPGIVLLVSYPGESGITLLSNFPCCISIFQ